MSGRLTRPLIPVALVMIVVGFLIVPAAWQVAHAANKMNKPLEQVTTVANPSNPELVAKLTAAETSTQSSPLILTYHDIGHNNSRYTVTPEVFAAQMQLLADAGWTTVTAAQLSAWLHGTPLPPHSVMISFDDGTTGVWRYADPILARNNQHAIAYVITGSVGTHAPYYMTWDHIAQLHSSGRWDFGSHTDAGHGQVPIDAAGAEGPFLTSHRFLSGQNRFESPDEYRDRVRRDLVASERTLVEHGLPEPAFLAFPFSSHEEYPPTATTEPGVLNAVVNELFQAAMLDSPDTVATTTISDLTDRYLDRMDITTDVSLESWVGRLVGASPINPPAARPFKRLDDWRTADGAELRAVAANEVQFGPGAHTYVSSRFAPDKTSMWRDYTVSADLRGFSAPGDGTSTGLIALSRDPSHQVEVTVGSGSYQIVYAGSPHAVQSGALPPASSYHAEIAVRNGRISVLIDGVRIATFRVSQGFPGAAGGVALSGIRLHPTSPAPRIANLEVR
ncbi:polysaccharide deacetylase family protein [Gordonia sp. NPDC003424]